MARPLDLLQRALGFLLGLVLLAAALLYASLILAVAAALAMVIGGWLWWYVRKLRRRAAEGARVVIEGQYRVEREPRRIDGPR
jgi:Mn2+/Fe2+ NRAMP family transporter